MRPVAGLAAALALAACSASAPVTTAGTASPTTTTTTATTTTTSTTTQPPTTTTAAPPPTTSPAPVCPPPVEGVTGDFDGDGTTDAAYVRELVLVACLAGGASSTLDVGGMGEVLLAVDLQGDGAEEILAGGTTAWGMGADVAVILDGELVAVMIAGERLQVWRGIPAGGVLDFGCADEDGDGRREVVLVEGEIAGGEVTAQRRAVAIDGAVASELSRATATVPLTGAVDVLSEPGIRELVGGEC